MSSQNNVLEAILSSSQSVFNVQSLRMLMECENSQKLTQSAILCRLTSKHWIR